MTVFDELKARGLLAQLTDEEEIKDLINNGKATFYIGFDPTADSLHVGHFMALCLMKRMQMAGNKPIALIGGGTAMIGDPSGRSDMRTMMTKETIQHNVDCFKKQMSRFIDFSDGKALMVNNADWLLNLNYVELLRDVGAHFSVNRMLTAECYKQRMEKGLSFLEFNYMIMQSFDFLTLYQKYGCNMQFGGDDQWSNMLGGTELIRRKLGKDAYAMTITLLLNSEGKKMGKTQKGAVWLDPNKTSPFEFYQYWRNVADADVLKCIRMLTFLPLEEIDKMDSWEGSQLNQAKEILAYELTKLVHGEEEAAKAQESARALFSKGVAADMPSVTLTADDFKDGAIDIVSVLVKSGLVTSRNEGRRAVEQGGVAVDGEERDDGAAPAEHGHGEGVALQVGECDGDGLRERGGDGHGGRRRGRGDDVRRVVRLHGERVRVLGDLGGPLEPVLPVQRQAVDVHESAVAGRRVPADHNGVARAVVDLRRGGQRQRDAADSARAEDVGGGGGESHEQRQDASGERPVVHGAHADRRGGAGERLHGVVERGDGAAAAERVLRLRQRREHAVGAVQGVRGGRAVRERGVGERQQEPALRGHAEAVHLRGLLRGPHRLGLSGT